MEENEFELDEHELFLIWEDLSDKYKKVFGYSFDKFKKECKKYIRKLK